MTSFFAFLQAAVLTTSCLYFKCSNIDKTSTASLDCCLTPLKSSPTSHRCEFKIDTSPVNNDASALASKGCHMHEEPTCINQNLTTADLVETLIVQVDTNELNPQLTPNFSIHCCSGEIPKVNEQGPCSNNVATTTTEVATIDSTETTSTEDASTDSTVTTSTEVATIDSTVTTSTEVATIDLTVTTSTEVATIDSTVTTSTEVATIDSTKTARTETTNAGYTREETEAMTTFAEFLSLETANASEYFGNIEFYSRDLARKATRDSFTRTGNVAINVILGTIGKNRQNERLTRFMQSSVDSLQVDEDDSRVVIVLAQSRVPRIIQESKVKSTESEFKATNIPLTGAPVLSIDVFAHGEREKINAMPYYVINIENDTSIDNYVIPMTQNESNRDTTIIRDIKYVCSYYDVIEESYSSKGCDVQMTSSTEVTCYCNHTTIFAVLLSVESFEIPFEVQVISYVTESISVLCLILTLIVLVKVRNKIRNDRTVVQINLTISLIFLHFFNLFHDLAIKNTNACETIAVLVHYFLLSTATWMFVEGFNLLIKTSDRALSFNKKDPKKVARFTFSLGWGIPAFIVVMATAIGFPSGTYMDEIEKFGYRTCWLNRDSGALLGSVIIPVIIIYSINLLIMIKVLVFVYKMSVKTERFKPSNERFGAEANLPHVKATFKGVALLFPVLGVPWIFSFLSGIRSYDVSIVFMYLNVILNGLQGFFLMLVYCVFGSEVRKNWIRKFNKSLSVIHVSLRMKKKTPAISSMDNATTNPTATTNTNSQTHQTTKYIS